MIIYYVLAILWVFGYVLMKEMSKRNEALNVKLIFTIYAGALLFCVMGFKAVTVGTDTAQYLYLYQLVKATSWSSIMNMDEWAFFSFMKSLSVVGINQQGFLIMFAFIVSATFSVFFYKYSKNIILSFYLHLTLGLFTMSMSGIRQTLAICLIIIAFFFMMKNKLVLFIVTVLVASQIHTSALVFLPIYLFKFIKVGKIKSWIIIFITVITLLLRTSLIPIIELLIPERYDKYGALSLSYQVNPLVVLTALAVPIVCLIFMNRMIDKSNVERKEVTIFFILSCMNAIINIISLNSNMIGRVSYYFLLFNMLLIPNVIHDLKVKNTRVIAVLVCIILPAIQFIISTPNGALKIDHYKFFWQLF